MARPTRSEKEDVGPYSAHQALADAFSQEAFPSSRRADPITPIPARASAHPSTMARIRSNYVLPLDDDDITRIPTVPQRSGAQRSRPGRYHVKSSIKSLPQRMSSLSPDEVQDVDEVVTQPPVARLGSRTAQEQELWNVADVDTLPPPVTLRAHSLTTPAMPQYSPVLSKEPLIASDVNQAFWLLPASVPDAQNQSWQQMHQGAEHSRFRPFDNLRWWLLHPGRLEFLARLFGTLLLVGATSALVLIGAFSLDIFSAGPQPQPAGGNNAHTLLCATVDAQGNSSGSGQNCVSITASSPAGLNVSMLNGDLLVTGTSLRLHGQGFSPDGRVQFTHDANLACEPAFMQADAHGAFTITMQFANDPDWQPGSHQMLIYDTMSKHTLTLPLMLTQN